MSEAPGIGPSTLQSDYLLATDKFTLLQSCATVLQEQIALDVPVDAGLAYQIQFYQNQMKQKAGYVYGKAQPGYIGIVALAHNFTALWSAMFGTEPRVLSTAYVNQRARTSADQVFSELGFQAGLVNQRANALASDLSVVDGQVAALDTQFDTVLRAAIDGLSAAAVADAAAIDTLKAAITKNINDIVAGANATGSAVSGLIIGVVTTIAGAKADADPNAIKDPKTTAAADPTAKDDPTITAAADPKAKGDPKATADPKPASAEFVVTGIQGASEGVAQTAQARADLNANNAKLAAAYQSLSTANALVAVAKVVQVQNDIFASAVSDSLAAVRQIAATWGQPPIAPPASGISLGFYNLAHALDAIASQDDANTLVAQLRYADTDWSSLSDQLVSLKQTLTQQPDS